MDNHKNAHQVIEARLPGPGDRIDDHTVMAEEVELYWSDMPKIVRFGFDGPPIGEILDVNQEKGRITMTAKVDLDKLHKVSDGEIEFYPGFIVRKMRMEGDTRVIEAADFMHVSMGFRYTPKTKPSPWERFRARLHRIVAKAKALLQSK